MAAFANSHKIGNHVLRPEGWADDSGQVERLRDFGRIHNLGLERLFKDPPSFMSFDLAIHTSVPDGGSGSSVVYPMPFPLEVHAVDLGCESAAGATGVLDLQRELAAGGGFSSILQGAAAADVKTGAGTATRKAPESGQQTLAYGDKLKLVGTSGVGGVIVGAQARVYAQRL